MIIFSGDCTMNGHYKQAIEFMQWFNDLPVKYKVMIAGNHDFYFDHSYYPRTERGIYRFGDYKPVEKERILNTVATFPNIIYLDDSDVTIEGIKIWGSAISPWFHDWAFNRHRGEEIKKHWDLIPNDTDILVTHGPPYKILDEVLPRFAANNDEPNVGCKDLINAIKRVKPKIVAFGHIHEQWGEDTIDDITYINASSLDAGYNPINPPIIKYL